MDADDPWWTRERQRMVHEQLEPSNRGITDAAVLEAMRRVPRHEFVPAGFRPDAYADRPLPIGHGQTISQPFIVALMCQMLDVRHGHRLLEIGTGCGYEAAVLAGLADDVFSVECDEGLAREAADRLDRLGVPVRIKVGDGWSGWPEHAPYDRIIVSCAPDGVPRALVDQLAEHGVMVLPVGPAGGLQYLLRLSREEGKLTVDEGLAVRFVPMVHPGPTLTPEVGR